jgi:aspartyl-tRNA(Asn)/glutamyl-tRNA(Gln) amidotransferase subunit C
MSEQEFRTDAGYTSNRLSEDEVRHLAHLARLALNDDEVKLFQTQLSEVIDYNLSLLKELDVKNIAPTSQTTGLENVWRGDQAEPSLPQEVVLREAPKQEQNQFMVPQVLGES